jgi:hypothetical protein
LLGRKAESSKQKAYRLHKPQKQRGKDNKSKPLTSKNVCYYLIINNLRVQNDDIVSTRKKEEAQDLDHKVRTLSFCHISFKL